MAEKKSVISQIQSVGEDALGKIAKNETARSALQSAMQLKDKGGKVLSGFEPIEKRLDAIEKRLATIEGHVKKPAAKRSTSGKSSSSKTHAASTHAPSNDATSTEPGSSD